MTDFGTRAARLCHAAGVFLGWRPDEFWRATPLELMVALQPPSDTGDAPDRATIEELKRRFPDQLKA